MKALRLFASLALASAINVQTFGGEMDCPRMTPQPSSSPMEAAGSQSVVDPLLEVTLGLLRDLLSLF